MFPFANTNSNLGPNPVTVSTSRTVPTVGSSSSPANQETRGLKRSVASLKEELVVVKARCNQLDRNYEELKAKMSSSSTEDNDKKTFRFPGTEDQLKGLRVSIVNAMILCHYLSFLFRS